MLMPFWGVTGTQRVKEEMARDKQIWFPTTQQTLGLEIFKNYDIFGISSTSGLWKKIRK